MKAKKFLVISIASIAAVSLGLILFPLVAPSIPPSAQKIVVTSTRETSFIAAMLTYSDDYGSFPKGDSRTIIKTLGGIASPKAYMEISKPNKNIFGFNEYSPMLDSQGNYLDAWGTPFLIKISNKDKIEIRSFGPNRQDDGGKSDDIVKSLRL